MTKSRAWSYIFIILVTVAVAFSAASLYNQSIRLDESQSLWMATKPLPSLFYTTAQDVHPPLYNLLLHIWIQVFGTDIVLARSLSFIFFLATLPVMYVMARESGNHKIALLSVGLFALSPFVLWYSNEARMYTLFTLVTVTSHLFYLRLIRSDGKAGKLGYVVATTIGLYVHYFFLLVVGIQGLYVIFIWLSRARQDILRPWWQRLWRHIRLPFQYGSLLIVPVGAFIPWLVYVFRLGLASNTQPSLPQPSSFNLLQAFVNFLFGFQNNSIQAILVALWPLSVMLLFFVFTQRQHFRLRQTTYFALSCFLPIIIVFGVSFIRPIFLSRYLIFTTPALFLLVAAMLQSYVRRFANGLAAGLLVVMLGLLVAQNTSAATPVKEDYRQAASYLEAKATPQDIIAVSTPFTIYPVEYSYHGHARLATIPNWDRYAIGPIPAFSLGSLKQQLDQDSQQYNRIFVVLSYDQGYQHTIKTYLDHHYQLLDHQQFSPGLEVRVYQLRYPHK